MFEFHASFVQADKQCRRLLFAGEDSQQGEHYFIMDRSEESTQVVTPDMDNIYIERDDQGWGGFGGVDRVILERCSLTLYLGPRMAVKMGSFETIRIVFALGDGEFSELREVLRLIMYGYEPQLELTA